MIAQHLMVQPNALGPYVDRLVAMRLVRRVLPVTDDPDAAVRRGLHVLDDNYIRFWFRYVDPNVSYLDAGQQAYVLDEKILPMLDHFTSTPVFEDAARQYLVRRRALGTLPVQFDRIGGWWRGVRADDAEEIDVVATERRRVCLVGKCKWTKDRVKIGDLNELRRKCAVARFPSDVTSVLFSRSGFDPRLVAVAREEKNVELVSIDDMYAPALRSSHREA